MNFNSKQSEQAGKPMGFPLYSQRNRSKRISLTLALFGAVSLASCAPPVVPSAQANYRTKAEDATDFIQRTMYVADQGLYHPSIPLDPKALPYDFMWGNGVQFSVLAAATAVNPTKYRPVLDAFYKGLEKHWDLTPQPFKTPGYDAYFAGPDGNDKYYDDNAWLILGMAEAFRATKDPKFLKKSRDCFIFTLDGYDEKLGGGIYWYQEKKTSKNTCINAPAAVGALVLYDLEKKPEDLEWAKKLYNWTNANLQDKDGLFWDNKNINGKVEKTKWTYNTALMIRANIGLYQATKDKKYLTEGRRVSDAAIAYFVDKESGAMKDSARFNHFLCEAFIHMFEATHDVKYLNAARRHADFGYRYVRDVTDGGYWNQWNAKNRKPDERKTMIENASAARLFWLLTPYADVEELRSFGRQANSKGNAKAALNFYQQAFESTAGAQATKIEVEKKKEDG